MKKRKDVGNGQDLVDRLGELVDREQTARLLARLRACHLTKPVTMKDKQHPEQENT